MILFKNGNNMENKPRNLTSYSLRNGHVEIRQPNTYCRFKMFFNGHTFEVSKEYTVNGNWYIDRDWTYPSFKEAKYQFLFLYEAYKM